MFAFLPRIGWTQKPHDGLPKLDKVLLWGVLSVRMEDAATTRYADVRGGGWHEYYLPQSMADSTPAMVGYGLAVSYDQYRASKFLIQHHMRWLATTTEIVHIAYDAKCANQNW